MGSPMGLALEYRPPSRVAANSCSSMSFSLLDDLPHEVHMLEDRLSALEEERRKIEAFRRELPLCMQLLLDAIEVHKEQLTLCKPSTQHGPHIPSSFNDTDSNLQSPSDRIVMEEYLPVKSQCEGELPYKITQKPYWMDQFVSREGEANSDGQEKCLTEFTCEKGFLQEQAFSTSSKPYFHSKNKSGGAFIPFSRDNKKMEDKQVVQPTPRLGPLYPTDFVLTHGRGQEGSALHFSDVMMAASSKLSKTKPKETLEPHSKEVVVAALQETNSPNDAPPTRKARRCWSPELHRRFINALQQLGGSEVATPKQIREVMKVEGLTNDEVKSHLQKYRLHTRRPSPTQMAPTQAAPQVVVLGGMWVPPDYGAHTAAQQASSSLYSQHQSHLCQPTSSQELCSELGQVHHNGHATLPQSIAPAQSQCSMHGPPLQFTNHEAVLYHNTSLDDDNAREESVGDDGGSGNSSCKGSGAILRLGKADEMEEDYYRSQDGSINQSLCTSDDGDSRGRETDLKMV